MKKPALIITILIGLIITLSMIKIIVYNRLSISGVFVAELEEKISYYKTQNAILSEDLLTSSSLTNILARASELGFVNKSSSLLVLRASKSLAVRP